MKIEGDEIVFSTGRRLPAPEGIVGIDTKGNVSTPNEILPDDGEGTISLTVEERHELATEMILRWASYYGENR